MERKQAQAEIDKRRIRQAKELAQADASIQWLKFQLDVAHRRPEKDQETNGH